MRRGGRRSAAEDAVVIIDGRFGRRPDPPPELSKRQAEIWKETVASEPSEFFNRSAERGLLGITVDTANRPKTSRPSSTRSSRNG